MEENERWNDDDDDDDGASIEKIQDILQEKID